MGEFKFTNAPSTEPAKSTYLPSSDAGERAHCRKRFSEELDTADEVTRERVALPLRHGGQGLADPSHIANQALVANWAACAPFLANTAPALSDIAKENPGLRRSARNAASHHRRKRSQGGPCHGHMRPAWDKIRGLGDEEQKILAVEFSDSTDKALPTKGAPTRTVTPGTRAPVQETLPGRIPRGIGLSMHFLLSPHAMTLHRVCLFHPRLQIAFHLCRMRIRQELDLPMPCETTSACALLQLAARGSRAAPRFRPPALRLLYQRRRQPHPDERQGKNRHPGGLQARWINHVHRAHPQDTRYEVTTNPDGTTTSLRPDIRVDGLRDTGITILMESRTS